jgi:ATP-dependent DNA ligase
MPGAQSRWSGGKDLSWEPLRPERVCEVKYDHLQGDRFRHAAVFLRWRPDKPAQECATTSWKSRRVRAGEGVRGLTRGPTR